MFYFPTYVLGALFWVSGMHGFHLTDPTLEPLLNPKTDSLTIRSSSAKGGLFQVRIVSVIRRNNDGVPLEFNQRLYYECAKCEKEKSFCSCNMQGSPSPSALRLKGIAGPMPASPLRKGEGSPLLKSSPSALRAKGFDGPTSSPLRKSEEGSVMQAAPRSPQRPNRLMQALAVCVSFPQLLCALCSTSDGEGVNGCYDEYVSPYILPEAEGSDHCRGCLFPFCPCCMSQEEM